MPNRSCPCGSKKPEKYCCKMYISGKKKPENPEKLMRSRYTAFTLGDIDYLIATLYPDRRKNSDRSQLTNTINNTQWLGLTIINTSKDNAHKSIAYVEFEVIYKIKEPQQLHERSKFIKSSDRWFYLEGDILPGTIPKRNEPCWCGSGKKYKQCHGV